MLCILLCAAAECGLSVCQGHRGCSAALFQRPCSAGPQPQLLWEPFRYLEWAQTSHCCSSCKWGRNIRTQEMGRTAGALGIHWVKSRWRDGLGGQREHSLHTFLQTCSTWCVSRHQPRPSTVTYNDIHEVWCFGCKHRLEVTLWLESWFHVLLVGWLQATSLISLHCFVMSKMGTI